MRQTTYKILMFAAPAKSGKHTIYLRVTYSGAHRYRSLNRHVVPSEWDADAGRFTKTFPNWKVENEILVMYEARAATILRNFERDEIPFSFEAFEAEMFPRNSATKKAPNLVDYLKGIAIQLQAEKRHGNSLLYTNLAHLLTLYKPSATMSDITPAWLARFEAWQRSERGMKPGGISANMRTLRAACNRAIKMGDMRRQWYPFDEYSIAHLNQPTPKRAITIEAAQRIQNAETISDAEAFARDLFTFSLYTRGMNLVDIAHLRPENIHAGRIEYERRKTHRFYSIALNDLSRKILEQFAEIGAYCFPILDAEFHITEKQQQERIHRIMVEINKALRAIAAREGIAGRISFYTARHTYATALKNRGVSTEIISEALGHSDLKTTKIYLRQLDQSTIDAADQKLF